MVADWDYFSIRMLVVDTDAAFGDAVLLVEYVMADTMKERQQYVTPEWFCFCLC